jgi:hypothetical protein
MCFEEKLRHRQPRCKPNCTDRIGAKQAHQTIIAATTEERSVVFGVRVKKYCGASIVLIVALQDFF